MCNLDRFCKIWSHIYIHTYMNLIVTCVSIILLSIKSPSSETTSSETTSSETTSSEGTGFIGSLLLDTINTHVLVTAHHVIPDMQTARNECSKFIFSRIDGSTVTTVTVKGSDLIDEHDVPKMCPKEMV